MPARKIVIDGESWEVSPSGFVTQYDRDEFSLLFVRESDKQHRVTRYSPVGASSRERSFVELSDDQLRSLFSQSQPGTRSPEVGYAR